MTRKGKSILTGSVAFVLFASMRNVVPLRNMLFYVAACSVFVIAALAAYFLDGRRKDKSGFAAGSNQAGSILAVIALAVWMVLFYVRETDTPHPLEEADLIRRSFPFPLWLVLMAAGVALCLFVLRKEPGTERSAVRKKIRMAVSLVFTALVSIQFYAPNIFQDIQGGVFHSHAYTNSIINVCWMIPYSQDMESLYGHYAILYMPFLKLLHRFFHVDYLTGLFLAAAVLAGISILFFLYILDDAARDDLIFYLGMFAVGEEYFMLMRGGVFLQVHPHRMIFPVILAALALREYKTGKRYKITSILILALSFVWSTEVGIVTLLSFALYRWVQLVTDGKSFSARKLLLLLREIAVYVLIPFGLSYGLINGYNLLAGGSILDFGEFMFPLISDRGYINNIELPLPDVTHAWIGASVLFLAFVCLALFQVFFPQKETGGRKPFYFLLGVMSLGLMLYYINRPVEGSLFIIMFLMLVLQAFILQKSQDVYLAWKEKKDSLFAEPGRFWFLALRIITVLILFIMAFDGLYSIPKAISTSRETIWKRKELQEFADYIYVQVPPDAVSFGEGVPELLSMIDRDTHLHTTEWSYLNMPLDTMERIRHRLEGEQWIFCHLFSLDYMQSNYPGLTEDYELHEVFEYNGAQFGLFTRK